MDHPTYRSIMIFPFKIPTPGLISSSTNLLYINFISFFVYNYKFQFSDPIKYSFFINYFMSSNLLWSLTCSQGPSSSILKENDCTSFNLPSSTLSAPSKMTYSIKQKKFVNKKISITKSLNTLKQLSVKNLKQKQNIQNDLQLQKNIKTLQISQQYSIKLAPQEKSFKKQTNPSQISFSQLKKFSGSSFFEQENVKQIKQLQLSGAQSIVILSQVGLKKQLSSQSTQCKCRSGQNPSIIFISKQKIGSKQLLRQGNSQKNLSQSNNIKNKQYASVVMPGNFKFNRIDEQDSDNSQSLKDVPTYSQKKAFDRNQYNNNMRHKSQNSSTFAINNSLAQSFKSRVNSRKNFNDMDVRSTRSIKQEESCDQFSQVLGNSFTLQTSRSKKISISRLMPEKPYYQE